jgi:hypothetical protein
MPPQPRGKKMAAERQVRLAVARNGKELKAWRIC